MSSSRRVVCIVAALLAASALATPVFAAVDWLTRPGTIAHAIEQPDGAVVYLDDVSIAKLKGNQNPAYFVVQEIWAANSRIIVSAIPPDVLRLGQGVDIEGTLGTLPNSMRVILNPRVIGYYDQSGKLLKNCPQIKSITGITPWQWKADIALPAGTVPSGEPLPGESNLDLPPAPVYSDSIASLLTSAPSSAARLECKRIVGQGIDPIYGAYLVLGDDSSPATIKVFDSGLATQSASSARAASGETARVNDVIGQVNTIGGETVLVLDEGQLFDPEGYAGSLQTVSSGTIAFAKSLADGVTVSIPDVIVADYDPAAKTAYVEDANRSGGIRVHFSGSQAVERGATVSITGTLNTNSDGERELLVGDRGIIVISAPISTLQPLGMINVCLGGSSFNELTPGINYPTPASGLYNKGLLVKIWGRVTAVNQAGGYFYVDDGSAIPNGSGPIGVKVVWNAEGGAAAVPSVGDYLSDLVGISSSTAVGPGQYARLLRLRYLARLAVAGSAVSKSVTLNWTTADHTSYHVVRALGNNGPYTLVADTTTGSFKDTGLTNGTTYYYRVSALESGIEGSASEILALTPTSGASPVTSINLAGTLGNNEWYVSAVTATISATDPDNDYLNSFYKLDGHESWTQYESELKVTSDGSHSISAYSVDSNGNSEDPANPVVSSFKIDATAPSVDGQPATQPNANGWYKANVVIHWSAVDAISGLAAPSVSAPGTPITFDTVLSGEGVVVDTATATDLAGNVGSKTVSVKIDKTPPTISAPPDIHVEATGKDGTAVSLGTPVVFDALDPNPAVTNDAPALFGLGTTVVTWTTIDAAGNATTAQQNVTVVGTPPVTVINLLGTSGQSGWFVSPVSVSMLATDPDNDVANTYYKLDDPTAAWTTYSSAFDVSTDGEHTVAAYSDDLASNVEDPPVEAAFNIDATAPVITGQPATQPNAKGWYKSDVQINWSFVDATSGLASPKAADPGVTATSTSTVSEEGAAVVGSVNATDVAGNTATKTISLKIDKTAPVITALYPVLYAGADNTAVCPLVGTAVDNLDAKPVVTQSPAVGTPLPLGLTMVTVTATDAAGNTSTASAGVTVIDTTWSTISSDFNGTPITAGSTVWFNLVVKPSVRPCTIALRNSVITFGVNGVPYSIAVPDSMITFSTSSSAAASTTYDPVKKMWNTVVPAGYSDNIFLAGALLSVTKDLPGGIKPVVWSGGFQSDRTDAKLQWKWGAAVYTQFSTDYSKVGAKPIEGSKLNPYDNSDHAGTPENYKTYVTGGARGGGGSNYTGGYSGTDGISGVCPLQ